MATIEIVQLPNALRLNGGVLLAVLGKKQHASGWQDISYTRPNVLVDEKKLARYCKAIGSPSQHGVPLLFAHVEAFGLAMLIFADERFPFKAIGMVHLANRVNLYQKIHVGDTLRIEVKTGELQAHDKGQALTMFAQAHRDGELVWSSTWTFLRPGIKNPVGQPYQPTLPDNLPLTKQSDITANIKKTRRYALVSGDVNPIHMAFPGAKLLGFKRTLAHGMWTKAQALALLMPLHEVECCEVMAEFKSPLYLPSTAALWSLPQETGSSFEVRNAQGDKLHLRGQLKFNQPQ